MQSLVAFYEFNLDYLYTDGSLFSDTRSATFLMKAGDELNAVILSIDRNEKKMSLGVKQLTKDPYGPISDAIYQSLFS